MLLDESAMRMLSSAVARSPCRLQPALRMLLHPQMVHFERMPARQAKFAEPARPLSAASRRALDARGVKSLFLHQAKVRRAEWRGTPNGNEEQLQLAVRVCCCVRHPRCIDRQQGPRAARLSPFVRSLPTCSGPSRWHPH